MKGMKINYALITDKNPQDFTNSVNLAMSEGWVPLGGVATTREPGTHAGTTPTTPTILYSQAMIRRGVNGVDLTV